MSSDVTREGLRGQAPERDARVGVASAAPKRPATDSYYGLPILNPPTWEPLDIAGYLFLGGLAGASSALAAAATVTGRPGLARPLRIGALAAISGGAVALVHDLGRPGRFYNMLRVLKPTSPMSVGSWILAAYGPAAGGAVLAPWEWARTPLTMAAGLLGPAVATYTSVLVADTAVPAWHCGYREMPFVFAGSAASAAGGLGLVSAPLAESGPARRLGVGGALAELAVSRVMRRRMGTVGEAYESGRAGRLMKVAEGLTAAGVVAGLAGRRSRMVSALSGACLGAGSAFTRFGIFEAGMASATDPRYTVEPQRRRLDASPSS